MGRAVQTPKESWRSRIEAEIADRVEVTRWSLRVTGQNNPYKAILVIDVRKLKDRDDEVDYWRDELETIEFIAVRYMPPDRDNTSKMLIIQFELVETAFSSPIRKVAA